MAVEQVAPVVVRHRVVLVEKAYQVTVAEQVDHQAQVVPQDLEEVAEVPLLFRSTEMKLQPPEVVVQEQARVWPLTAPQE